MTQCIGCGKTETEDGYDLCDECLEKSEQMLYTEQDLEDDEELPEAS